MLGRRAGGEKKSRGPARGASRSKGQIRMIQVVFTISALVVGAGGGWLWWVGPKTKTEESIVQMQERTAKLRDGNSKTRKALVDLGEGGVREALDVYLRQERFLRGMMPPEDTISRLLTQLTTATRRNSVSIGEFSRLERREIGGFAGTGFSFQLTGRYHDVGTVMAELLGAERISHIYNASITAVSPDGNRGSMMAARDLQSLNFGAQGRQSWQVKASFDLYELGLSKTPTQYDLKERADSLAKVRAAELAKKAKKKKRPAAKDSATKEP